MDGKNNRDYEITKQCPKCGSTWLRIKLTSFLDIPANQIADLNKEMILDKDVSIEVNWRKHKIYCPSCGWNLLIDIP